jgi:hypothetical protein
LTVDSSRVRDLGGNYGIGSASTSWLMDTTAPTSNANSLAQRANSLTFPVSVTGSDPTPGSGVSSYDIYVAVAPGSSPLGPFTFWTAVPANNPIALFTAQSNATYAFHTIAHDAAGNLETKAANLIEASTFVPDLTPPTTQITSDAADSTGSFILEFSGSSLGGSGVKAFVLSVQVDGGPTQQIGTFPGGTPIASVYSGQTSYQGLTDGISHVYVFSIQGINGNGIAETPHAATPVAYTFAVPLAPAVTAFVVEKGLSERSYIRYVDVTFNQPTSALNLGANAVALEQFGLDGTTFVRDVSLTGKINLIDHVMEIDFGAGGIGGSENLPSLLGNWSRLIADDGYYKLIIDPDGSGLHDVEEDFYRLFGNVLGNSAGGPGATGSVVDGNAIGVVGSADVAAISAAVGQMATAQQPLLNADINGAGAVTANDRLLAAKSVGRRLAGGLHLDD